MLTEQENERLTRVGPGTPGGELLRRYWHPVAIGSDLAEHGAKPVTVLGESLVLYRDRGGTLGLVDDHCPHRRGGMVFAVPEEHGLRCAYHGWLYDETGRCLEQPYEMVADPNSTFKDKVRIKAYPVEELGGLIFAYLGPEPVPLLPRWDLFVMENVLRDIGSAVIPCNWLQCVENGVDGSHVPWLHGNFTNYALERLGRPDIKHRMNSMTELLFVPFEQGIMKKRVSDEDSTGSRARASEEGHPLLFPYTDRVPPDSFKMRIPLDDHRTWQIWYTCYGPDLGLDMTPQDPLKIPKYEVPVPGMDALGNPEWQFLDNNSGQDMAMWYTQGAVADRTKENLGLGDIGVIAYRKLLDEQIRIVEDGGDPMNVFRDPEKNQCIVLPGGDSPSFAYRTEYGVNRSIGSRKYSPILREAAIKLQGEAAVAEPIH